MTDVLVNSVNSSRCHCLLSHVTLAQGLRLVMYIMKIVFYSVQTVINLLLVILCLIITVCDFMSYHLYHKRTSVMRTLINLQFLKTLH